MDKIIKNVAAMLEEHKVEDIKIIDVSDRTPFSTHYILGTVMNFRQLMAMSDYVEEELAKHKLSIRVKDGNASSGWIVIDEGNFMIHLFTKEAREKVLLEELFK